MKNLDVLNAAVSVIVKAALLAARWSGRARRRSLERLGAADADAKDKELLFLRDKVFLLETQLSLLLMRLNLRPPSISIGKHHSSPYRALAP